MGRRKGPSPSEQLLRAEIAKALLLAIGGKRGALSSAAKSLGITKQALSLYLRQRATPGSEVLKRICKQWNLHLNVQGALVDAGSEEQANQGRPAQQMSLFAALATVTEQKLDVAIIRKHESSLELKVTIDFKETLPSTSLEPR